MIDANDKNSKYTEANQKSFTSLFQVASHYILMAFSPENKFQTPVAEFKLKIVGSRVEERKVKDELVQKTVDVYYEDEPLYDIKIHSAEAWEKETQKKLAKASTPKKPSEKKAPVRKEPKIEIQSDGSVKVTKELARTKFMQIGKPVRHLLTSMLGYYINDLNKLREEGPITPDLIEKSGKISKFVWTLSKTMDMDKTFDSRIFGDYADQLGNMFSKSISALRSMVSDQISGGTFGQTEREEISKYFANFVLAIIRECSIHRAGGRTVNNSLIYSILKSCSCTCANLGFDINEVEEALKKDCDTAMIVLKKVTAKKGTATKTVPPKVVPSKVVPTKVVTENTEFDVENDFDI
jgi:hypothetical protein